MTLKETKALIEALEGIYSDIERKIEDAHEVWEETDELVQCTQYDYEQHVRVPVFNEDGSPKMENRWTHVKKDIEDLNEDKRLLINAYERIRKELDKLI